MYAIRSYYDFSLAVKASEVNWHPWSELKISGQPYRSIASVKAARQNEVSKVFDNRQERTFRLAQSMIAARYTYPLDKGI